MLRLWNAVVDLVYPPGCCHCGAAAGATDFCDTCAARISRPLSPYCTRCGLPFRTRDDATHTCERCLSDPPSFGTARAAAIYDTSAPADHPLKSVLQRYKYNRDVALAAPLARLLGSATPFDLADYDLIVPVPLHIARLRWRGFNQAALLAARIARSRRIPVDAFSLERRRATQPQVELDEKQRRHNVASAFAVTHPERIARRRILLVDDVYTTGSTVNECSHVLRRAGAERVDVLILARAILS